MKNKMSYVPVKKILAVINSCHTNEQIQDCKKIVNEYVKAVAKQGVTNSSDLKDRLNSEIEQREEALYLVEILT
jgi:hypothetical protein